MYSEASSYLGQVSLNQSTAAQLSSISSSNTQFTKKLLSTATPSNQANFIGIQNSQILNKAGTEKENFKFVDSESTKTFATTKPAFYEEDYLFKQQQQQQAFNQKYSQQQGQFVQKQAPFQPANAQVLAPPQQQLVFSEDNYGYPYHEGADRQPAEELLQDEAAPANHEQTFEELMEQIDKENDSEDEGIQDYKIGGYHPVHIGEAVNGRYVIIQKIGWGHFSTVWLAKDFKFDTYVALKIQKSAPHYMEAAFDEVEILQKVARMSKDPEWMKSLQHYYAGEKKNSFNKNDCQVVQLLNSFVYKGPYGNHFCFVFEILGVNLLEVIKRYNYQGVPLHLCKKIAKQVLIGLDFLHRFCSVIHTDLKPENVLLQLTNEEIADIVDNGQITKNQLFKERLDKIRKQLGIHVEEEKKQPEIIVVSKAEVFNQAESEGDEEEEDDEENDGSNLKELELKLKQAGLTKKQKKNLRKKINKKKRRQAEQKGQDIQEKDSKNQETTLQLTNALIDTAKQEPEKIDEKQLFSQINTKLLDKNKMMRGPHLDDNFKLKIADLGNACWTFHHFATEIQTRQYRSPEVITGSKYNETADVWSLACMLFEMLTGDFLFEPRKGPTFSKNDDHLAQIEELCKKFPKGFAKRGEKSKKYFDQNGNLRRIPQLQYWPLRSVLIEKYKMKEKEAKAFESFMMPMLHSVPEKRATAQQMLDHPWLQGSTEPFEYKQTEQEQAEYLKRKQILIDIAKLQGEEYVDPSLEDNELYDDDIYDGDGENSSDSGYDQDDQDNQYLGTSNKIDLKLVDRSFTNLGYIGFGDGIDLEALDNTGNWQFQNI